MRPSTPSASANGGLGLLQRQTAPSSPPYTPTTPKSPFHPSSPSSPECPSANQRRGALNFSRPLAPQSRGSENRYAPLTWLDLGRTEGGGYIQPLPGTNRFSYVPASRGRPDDPSSPRSSSPEPSEDNDDDDSSVSPRSLTDDDDFVEREQLASPRHKTKKLGKGTENKLLDEDEDEDMEKDGENRYDRGRRRRSTIKAKTTFVLEEMPSRSQERDPENMMNSNDESLIIIQPDRYSDADTMPSRDHSADIHDNKHINTPGVTTDKPMVGPASFLAGENGTTDTDASQPLDPKIMESMSTLNCESEDDREAWLRRKRQEKRQKRWSLGSQKRSITQSIGSGTDEEDLHGDGISVVGGDEGGVTVGGSARRLRRRTGVGGERPNLKRVSLLFEDPPKRIVEVDEPESDFGGPARRSLEVEVMDDELPYFVGGWEGDVDMDE